MTIAPNLNLLLKLLIDNDLDFIVIGGFAGVLHGSTMVTRDLDICMLMAPEKLELLRQILSPYHPMHRRSRPKLSFETVPNDFEGLKNLYLDTDLGTLDILGDMDEIGTYLEISQRAKEISLFGNKIKILSVDDLIRSKQLLNRPKDLLMIEELKTLRKL